MEIVTVIYHKDPDGWWADSPDVPGWTATAGSLDELTHLAGEGVRFALERDDVVVDARLDYGVELGVMAYADVTFDFLSGRTITHPRVGAARGHWQVQAV
jgi:predicted RNase H-like HicB family nuclease